MEYIAEDLRELAVPVDELRIDPANVRQHPPKNRREVRRSLEEFGQRLPIVVREEDNRVEVGNLRLEIARELGWDKIAVVSCEDSEIEAERFAIAENATGDLSEFDEEGLGPLLDKLEDTPPGFDGEDVDDLLEDLEDLENGGSEVGPGEDGSGDEDGGETYTKHVETPQYEPTADEQPQPESLVDRSRTLELKREIVESDLPEDVERFLRIAAERHTKFNFERIAEFYAHADPEVQRLMERSALVIIDVEDALEEGFLRASDRVLETVEDARDAD